MTNETLFIGLLMNWAAGAGKGWGCKTQMTSPDLGISAAKEPKDKKGSGSPWCHPADFTPQVTAEITERCWAPPALLQGENRAAPKLPQHHQG